MRRATKSCGYPPAVIALVSTSLRQQPLLLQIPHDLHHALLDAHLVGPEVNLGGLRRLVRRADAREVRDLARARLLVQALGVALLGHRDGDVDENLDEGDGLVGGAAGGGV